MRAVSRVANLLLAGGLALAPATTLAQQAPATTNTPAVDAVGPKELQDFSLKGAVTTPSNQTVLPATPKRQPRTAEQSAGQVATTRPSTERVVAAAAAATPAPRRTETASADSPPPLPKADPGPEPVRQSPPSSSVTVALPGPGSSSGTASPAAAPAFAPPPEPVGTLAPEHRFPILPWILAFIALVAGGAFLFWRGRERHAYAGGPSLDAFAPPPAPAPAPAPRPAPASPPPSPSSLGIVSTRLRPWVDLGFQPLRCILEDHQVTVEFEIELFNSGSAPARAVLAEATLINAGANQDRDVEAFFANPVGQGERIVTIPPLKRVSIRTKVVAPREQVQAYELAGKQVFVPVIAFNVLYKWSTGEGQTSASYLLGRDTKGDKLAPFRLDLGARIFRGLAARQLSVGVRQ